MKKIILLLIFNLSLLIFNQQSLFAQNVFIPDANFKAALVGNSSINTNGDANIQVSEAVTYTGNIDVNNMYISDITGISAFTNITSLNCSSNQLTSLNVSANTALTNLDCSYNQLTSLDVSANTALTSLDCSFNLLTSLNVSGSTALIYLFCSSNLLTSLNVSANTALSNLGCYQNQLTSIDVSANTALTYLDCNNNQLTSLNISANTALTTLYCNNNQLTSLNISANTAVTYLNCSNNQLTSIDVSANTALIFFYCSYNQLTSLNISANTALTYLNFNYNQLTSLNISANTALTYLNCNYNQLTSIDISVNTALIFFYCSYNQLTSLNVSANTALTKLDCNNNQLTNLSQVPNQMQYFRIDNNNISCLYNLPQIANGSNLSNFNISNNPFSCVPNQTNYSGSLPLCMDNDPINNPNNCQSVVNITGNVYTDLNNNCTSNITDWNTQNIPVKVYDMQSNFKELSYTINGVYSFAALQPDSFQIKIDDANLPIAMACGQSNTKIVDLDSMSQSITGKDFPVVCDSIDNKVKSITRTGWVFPGQVHKLQTNVSNDIMWYHLYCGSLSNYSGTVSIQLTGPVTYIAPYGNALTPQVNGNMLTYNITNFDSLTPLSLGLKLLTDTTAQVGDQICVHVEIHTTPTDIDTTNNVYDYCYNVVNSYDPNEKEVYPSSVLPGYNDWFTYTVHFQNTGTAPAFNIRLRDTLDSNLDYSSFEFLGASHTAKTNLIGNVLSVRFENIMLPDSTTDHDGSMGYYQYRVKPLQNLPLGSNIKNTAYIYFDYNPAIVTNTTESKYEVLTSGPTQPLLRGGEIQLYPNPTHNSVTITSKENINNFAMMDLLGNEVVVIKNTTTMNKLNVNLEGIPRGIYICKVNGKLAGKVVKE